MFAMKYLTNDDFYIAQSPAGLLLCHNIRGVSMVTFYSKGCEKCIDFLPIFKQMPGSVVGVEFGLVNLDHYPGIIKMSERTITPIKYVPLIILYVNGRPFMKYNGARTLESMSRFIVDSLKRINTDQQFIQTTPNQHGTNRKPPQPRKQLHGIPYNTIEDPYKTIEKAYHVGKQNPQYPSKHPQPA